MKKREKETELKRFLKSCYLFNTSKDDGLFFVEAGAGGSEGMADVFWEHDRKLIPVELKCFDSKFVLRPSQHAFHRSCAKLKIPSIVVAWFYSPKQLKEIEAGFNAKPDFMFFDGRYVSEFSGLGYESLNYILDRENEIGNRRSIYIIDHDAMRGQSDDSLFMAIYARVGRLIVDIENAYDQGWEID